MDSYFEAIAKAEKKLCKVEDAIKCVHAATKDLRSMDLQLSYIDSRGCITIESMCFSTKHPLGAAVLAAIENHREQLIAALNGSTQGGRSNA